LADILRRAALKNAREPNEFALPCGFREVCGQPFRYC
jgi:hypothetical protein